MPHTPLHTSDRHGATATLAPNEARGEDAARRCRVETVVATLLVPSPGQREHEADRFARDTLGVVISHILAQPNRCRAPAVYSHLTDSK